MKKHLWFKILFLVGSFIAIGDMFINTGYKVAWAYNEMPDQMSLKGVIGKTMAVHMTLDFRGAGTQGTYYYDKYKQTIKLTGHCYEDMDLRLEESDDQGRVTGKFEGKFVSRRRIEGFWSKPDGSGKLPFVLEDCKEINYTNNPLKTFLEDIGIADYTKISSKELDGKGYLARWNLVHHFANIQTQTKAQRCNNFPEYVHLKGLAKN